MSNARTAAGRVIRVVLAGVAIAATFAFMSVQLVLVLPRTPVALALEPHVGRIFRSYFFQTWNVFAPLPIDFSWTLRVDCDPSAPEPVWHDLTSRWTAEPARTFTFGLHLAELQLMLATKVAGRSANGDPAQRAASAETLRRLGSRACARLAPASSRMRMRLDLLRAPDWLNRRAPPTPEVWDLGDMEIAR